MSESHGRDNIELRAGPFCFTETWHAPALVLPPHEHEHACLHFVLAGCYPETVAGRTESFEPGTVLYKPAGVSHSNRFTACGARTIRIEFASDFGDSLGACSRRPLHAVHPGLELVARRVHDELVASDELTPLALEGLARELVALLFRQPHRADEHVRLAEDCAVLLRERFRARMRLGELASALECDRTALARAFRSRFGTSMGEYVRTLRVAEVMRLLETSDATLAAIALGVGFSDQSHCTRVFRRLAGVTPAAWSRTRIPDSRRRPRREPRQR